MHRLFFALQPAPGWGACFESAAPVDGVAAAAAPASNLHATLFSWARWRLGLRLRAAAARVRGRPIELYFDVFEFWELPSVLVAGATVESVAANALSIALRDATVAAGFTPDSKPFRAHLTLARKIQRVDAEKILWPQKISPGFVVRADSFVLMESQKGEQGSIYSALDSWPLYETEEPRITQ